MATGASQCQPWFRTHLDPSAASTMYRRYRPFLSSHSSSLYLSAFASWARLFCSIPVCLWCGGMQNYYRQRGQVSSRSVLFCTWDLLCSRIAASSVSPRPCKLIPSALSTWMPNSADYWSETVTAPSADSQSKTFYRLTYLTRRAISGECVTYLYPFLDWS